MKITSDHIIFVYIESTLRTKKRIFVGIDKIKNMKLPR